MLIIFGPNIPDTTENQMTIYVPVAPNVFSALPGENKTSKILHFYSMPYDYLIRITHIWHILSKFLAHWLTVYPIV